MMMFVLIVFQTWYESSGKKKRDLGFWSADVVRPALVILQGLTGSFDR